MCSEYNVQMYWEVQVESVEHKTLPKNKIFIEAHNLLHVFQQIAKHTETTYVNSEEPLIIEVIFTPESVDPKFCLSFSPGASTLLEIKKILEKLQIEINLQALNMPITYKRPLFLLVQTTKGTNHPLKIVENKDSIEDLLES